MSDAQNSWGKYIFPMIVFTKILAALESDDRAIVMPMVEKMIHSNFFPLSQKVIDGLIAVVKNCEDDESNAPLWAIVILGDRKVKKAIPVLLDVFYTDADFWCEASQTALQKIGKTYPDDVYTETQKWIENLLKDLESSELSEDERQKIDSAVTGRVYAYGVIESFVPREDVKQYLMELIERDQSMGDCMEMSLLGWPLEQSMRSFFRRQVELAVCFGGTTFNSRYNESKWALIHFTDGEIGLKYPYRNDDQGRSWQDWDFIFDYGKDEEENEEEKDKKTNEKEKINQKEDSFYKKLAEERKKFDEFELPQFNIEEYVAVRPRSHLEQKIQDMLKYYDLTDRWSVESIQVQINRAHVPSEVQKSLLELVTFENIDEANIFCKLFSTLWNLTPREEFQGLTPDEKRHTIPINSISHEGKREKTDRNAHCPCGKTKETDGTPVKYKKCCGR